MLRWEFSELDITPVENRWDRGQVFDWLTCIDLLNLQIMSRPLRIEFPDAWYHVMIRAKLGHGAFFR